MELDLEDVRKRLGRKLFFSFKTSRERIQCSLAAGFASPVICTYVREGVPMRSLVFVLFLKALNLSIDDALYEPDSNSVAMVERTKHLRNKLRNASVGLILTHEDLADAFGYTSSVTIWSWLNGKRLHTHIGLLIMLYRQRLSIEDVLTDEEKEELKAIRKRMLTYDRYGE